MRKFHIEVTVTTPGGPNIEFKSDVESDITDEQLIEFQNELTKEMEEFLNES